jgi:hypothetical protein
MDDRQLPSDDPEWLDEFQELADQQLGDGSSCEQVHPIIERWYDNLMQNDPPESRDAVMQAMACLSTEILYNTPDNVLEAVLEHVSEDELASWIEFVLMVGRAFEVSLRSGDLDDL